MPDDHPLDDEDWDFGSEVDQFILDLEHKGQIQKRDFSNMSGDISTATRQAGEAAELAAAGMSAAGSNDDVNMSEAEERAKRMRQEPPAPAPGQLPPGMAAFAALLDNKFAEQNAANEKTFKSTLKHVISEEVGPVRETVNALQQEQTRQGDELNQLQAIEAPPVTAKVGTKRERTECGQ